MFCKTLTMTTKMTWADVIKQHIVERDSSKEEEEHYIVSEDIYNLPSKECVKRLCTKCDTKVIFEEHLCPKEIITCIKCLADTGFRTTIGTREFIHGRHLNQHHRRDFNFRK